MTSLLEFWLDRLEAPVTELGGDRQRYGRFGWENAGREYRFRLNSRSIPDAAADSSVAAYDGGDEQVDLLRRMHTAESLRVERTRRATRRIHDREGNVTLLHTGDYDAYISFSPRSSETTVTEFGGSSEGVVALLSAAFDRYDFDSATMRVPPEHPITPTVRRIEAGWQLNVQRKLNVRDLPALLSGFESQIERRMAQHNVEHTDIRLGIGDGTRARIVRDDGVTVERTTDESDITLDRRKMTHLLFGLPGLAAMRILTRL